MMLVPSMTSMKHSRRSIALLKIHFFSRYTINAAYIWMIMAKDFAYMYLQVMTGSGTFESYVSVGNGCAATPDGRLNRQPTASDFSPQPYAQVHYDESTPIVLLYKLCTS